MSKAHRCCVRITYQISDHPLISYGAFHGWLVTLTSDFKTATQVTFAMHSLCTKSELCCFMVTESRSPDVTHTHRSDAISVPCPTMTEQHYAKPAASRKIDSELHVLFPCLRRSDGQQYTDLDLWQFIVYRTFYHLLHYKCSVVRSSYGLSASYDVSQSQHYVTITFDLKRCSTSYS